ncbi:MAG: tRNA (guanosine(46)-N7)-methyltransferase TrmB [Oleiphilaceae bacterium]|nr:tRNA (guanosine(46)-N7)-methyltransferase TrmB [Oleiphilaceae bacterium]
MSEQQDKTHEKVRRGIKSFVVRSGRMTLSQQRGWDQYWAEFGLEPGVSPQALQASFGNDHPLVLEIGFGMGQSLFEMARDFPEFNYLGVEVHRPGVGALLSAIGEAGLNNVRLFCCDANEVLNQSVADASLARLQLFFPDPWHKKRHHKRRLVQPEFVERVRSKLAVGGHFHMATDWEPYAEHMREVMEANPSYENIAGQGQYSEKPEYRPTTKFEKRGQRLGHGVWDLIYRRVV